MPFDDYLQMPGLSYSGIKAKGLQINQPTSKMQIGTMVHNYLFEPEKYEFKLSTHKIVTAIAQQVKLTLGDAMIGLESEVSVTADFLHDGFKMQYKGRVDLLRAGKMVIDLKVSEMWLNKSIPYFGYDRQLSGYSLATGAKLQMILRINPVTLKTEVKMIPISSDWWESQILKYGKV